MILIPGENMTLDEIHKINREAYNILADKYHEMFKNEMNEKIFDRMFLDKFAQELPRQALVCDAGCGPSAHIGRYLFNKSLNVFGIDISERCIEIAREYNPEMNFECTDFLTWNQQPESLDAIISYYSITYTPKKDVNKILEIFYNKLKKNGKLLVVVKKGDCEGFQEKVLEIDVHPYFVEYNENELADILSESGFTIEEITTRTPYENEINNERIYCTCKK